MVNLALGSSEKVLRSRGTNFVLDRSRFDEVWVPKQALDTSTRRFVSASGGADLGQCAWVPRVRHRTHALDSPGCIRSLIQGGLQLDWALDARTGPNGVRQVPYQERVVIHPHTGRGHRTHCECVRCVAEKVQLAVNRALDALCSASGATSSASGAPVFCEIRVADPWT